LHLFRQLKSQGQTIILITHKLNEVLSVADRISVMRQGKLVKTVQAASSSAQELAHLMIGEEWAPRNRPARAQKSSPKTLFELRNVSTSVLKNISLSVSAGEIVGIAGVEGSGQSDLVALASAQMMPKAGDLFFEGKPLRS